MKDSGIHFFMIISLVTLVGCAALHEPTSEQIELANYGRYPDNYKEIVTNFMSDLLFDPYSAVYSGWCGPKKGWVGGGLLGYKFGYGACVKINAKNRMGGYVGEKLYYFVINNGQIVHHDGGYRNGSYGEQKIIKFCDTIGFDRNLLRNDEEEPPLTIEEEWDRIKRKGYKIENPDGVKLEWK